MSADKKIIVPGTDHPGTLLKVIEALVEQERVATVIVRRGERFILKFKELRKELLVGEVRCLHWSADMTRRIWESHDKDRFADSTGRSYLLADAIDKWGHEAHRYRVYIPTDEITAVYEDMDERFDATPYLPLP